MGGGMEWQSPSQGSDSLTLMCDWFSSVTCRYSGTKEKTSWLSVVAFVVNMIINMNMGNSHQWNKIRVPPGRLTYGTWKWWFGRWFPFPGVPYPQIPILNLRGGMKRWNNRSWRSAKLLVICQAKLPLDNEPLDDREKLIERFAGYRFVALAEGVFLGILFCESNKLTS